MALGRWRRIAGRVLIAVGAAWGLLVANSLWRTWVWTGNWGEWGVLVMVAQSVADARLFGPEVGFTGEGWCLGVARDESKGTARVLPHPVRSAVYSVLTFRTGRSWMVQFPAWWITGGVLMAGGVLTVAGRRAARRVAVGACAGCGYDLRATPSHGLCPECGRPR